MKQREDELLICCSRVSPDPTIETRIAELAQMPLDWQTVLDRCWWHRIRPLTYFHLRAQPTGVVPDHVLEELAGHATEMAARNLRLARALDEVTAMFEENELRVLVFKGPTLTMEAYGDLSLRECGDLDMLIHREDFPRVRDVLQSNRYACLWDQPEGTRRRQAFACEFRCNGIELDVHWDLVPGWLNYHVNFDRLWDGGETLARSGYARKLRPEDSIVVLCIHGTKHWWERLRWICDIAELVNSGCVTDWDRVNREAAETNSRRAVDLGLWLSGDLLSANLPDEIRKELSRSPAVIRLADQVGVWLGHGERGAELRRLRERFLFRWRLCERARDRLPQLVHYLLAVPWRLSTKTRLPGRASA